MNTMEDRILAFIEDHIALAGYPPTVRQIGSAVGLSSTSSVSYHLDRLASQGRLKVTPGVARGLKVLR